jgi:hypothetical protein
MTLTTSSRRNTNSAYINAVTGRGGGRLFQGTTAGAVTVSPVWFLHVTAMNSICRMAYRWRLSAIAMITATGTPQIQTLEISKQEKK